MSTSKKKKERVTDKKKQHGYKCPQCHHVITLDALPQEDTIIQCPSCGQGNLIKASEQQSLLKLIKANHLIKYGRIFDIEKGLYKPILPGRYLGIPLIFFGVLVLLIFTSSNIKLGVSLMIMGIIIFLLLPVNKYLFLRQNKTREKKYPTDMKIRYPLRRQFDFPEQITLMIMFLIIVFYFLTGVENIELFLILIIIVVLIFKEIFDEFMSYYLKKQMNMLILSFFIVFILAGIKTIINHLHI